MKKLLFNLLILVLWNSIYSFGQITFQKTFGGTGSDAGVSCLQTIDGGYVITGLIENFGAGGTDIILIKTDALGDTLWTKTFGGSNDDGGRSFQQTRDSGFIITGFSVSFNNIYLIKTNSTGNLLWTKTFGGTGSPEGESVIQTSDGGYFISGDGSNINLIKTDANGDTLWTRNFGGTGPCKTYSVQQTNDGGYVITGYAHGSVTSVDYYLLKLNATGDSLWSKTYGSMGDEEGRSLIQTNDGGYMIAGNTIFGFGATGEDIYLLKLDSSGNVLWSKTYGGINEDRAYSIVQTADMGFIISGSTMSFGAGDKDVYLLKTDSNGIVQWSKTFGGSGWDEARSVRKAADGGYIITGFSASFNAGDFDIYLIKTDANGNSGCNQGIGTTISDTAATITGSTGFLISSGSPVTSPATITGSGFPLTTICFNNSVNEIEIDNSNFIYPNPSNGNFTISLANSLNNVSIEIYNILGEKIFQENVNTTSLKRINLTNISRGLYFVNVYDGQKKYTRKLIVAYD